ncbi:hypothetical protein IHE44_0002167, partial [Lamprotornis superbus]
GIPWARQELRARGPSCVTPQDCPLRQGWQNPSLPVQFPDWDIVQPAVSEASVPVVMLLETEPDGICRVGHGWMDPAATEGSQTLHPSSRAPWAPKCQHRADVSSKEGNCLGQPRTARAVDLKCRNSSAHNHWGMLQFIPQTPQSLQVSGSLEGPAALCAPDRLADICLALGETRSSCWPGPVEGGVSKRIRQAYSPFCLTALPKDSLCRPGSVAMLW